MKKNLTNPIIILMLLILFMSCNDKKLSYHKLPSNVCKTCSVDKAEFSNWFQNKEVTLNGQVNPANSVTFPNGKNCDFYKWAEHMFLWITSPEGSHIVLENDNFYTVSTANQCKKRTLIPHNTEQPLTASVNIMKSDTTNAEGFQATDDVLMSQNGSILYYMTFVNDVYKEFLEGADDKAVNDSVFPTTKAELKAIEKFALQNGAVLKNPNTLAMELKTSWVDAATITSNKDSYITVKAMVPTYSEVSSIKWVPSGTEEKTLALLGMHIVGSVAGHPEMIWATFEHINNAPNLSYEYLNDNNKKQKMASDIGNDWLLNANSASKRYNKSHMTMDTMNQIIAKHAYKISPSNTKRVNAFGVSPGSHPNNEDKNSAAANSQIISINNDIMNYLIDTDLRKNYIFIGATWTQGGAAPNAKSYDALHKKHGAAVGSNQLANSTMETYAQYGTTPFPKKNASCFACHSSTSKPSLVPGEISHIYNDLKKTCPKKD
jgi:hypothetical protein